MQIVEVLNFPPACCFICRKGSNGEPNPFIDTLRNQIDSDIMANRIYVCFECVEELAGIHGFVSPVEAQKLKDAVDSANIQIEAMEAREVSAQQLIEAVQALAPKPKPAKKAAAE